MDFSHWFTKFFFASLFGLVMEVGVSAVRNLVDCVSIEFSSIEKYSIHNIIQCFKIGWTKSEKLRGDVSLLMVPIYGFGLVFLFEPVFYLVQNWEVWQRFVLWMISFTSIEVITGFLYVKLTKHCPWDYREMSDVLFSFTRYGLLPWWGFAGLCLESYIVYISLMIK